MTAHKIPATIITGFLGAGKTTLIRNLVENSGQRRLALVINEFGDLAMDGTLLKDCGNPNCNDENLFELANGCICCTVADDFLPTINAILALPDQPDHIVIETSGLALPKPLVQAFSWPDIRTRVTVDGVVTVLDGPAVLDGRFADDPEKVQAQRRADDQLDHESPLHELFEDQLSCADLVLLNKTDLLTRPAIEDLTAELLARLRGGVRMVPTVKGEISADVLLGIDAGAEDDLDSRPSHHDDEEDHDHDEFESLVVSLPEIIDPSKLAERIREVTETHDVLRVKGFVRVTGKDMRLVIHGVGPRVDYYYDRPWNPSDHYETKLVVIGLSGMDQSRITTVLQP